MINSYYLTILLFPSNFQFNFSLKLKLRKKIILERNFEKKPLGIEDIKKRIVTGFLSNKLSGLAVQIPTHRVLLQ